MSFCFTCRLQARNPILFCKMRATGRDFIGLSMNYLLLIPITFFLTRVNGIGRHAKSLIHVKLPASTIGVASFGPSREAFQRASRDKETENCLLISKISQRELLSVMRSATPDESFRIVFHDSPRESK